MGAKENFRVCGFDTYEMGILFMSVPFLLVSCFFFYPKRNRLVVFFGFIFVNFSVYF